MHHNFVWTMRGRHYLQLKIVCKTQCLFSKGFTLLTFHFWIRNSLFNIKKYLFSMSLKKKYCSFFPMLLTKNIPQFIRNNVQNKSVLSFPNFVSNKAPKKFKQEPLLFYQSFMGLAKHHFILINFHQLCSLHLWPYTTTVRALTTWG